MKTSQNKLVQKLLQVNQHKKIKLGLFRSKKALSLINWENKIKTKTITINGTSAKFSIIHILKNILIFNKNSFSATYSPHIKNITERIEVNSKFIKLGTLKKILEKICRLPVNLTEFEKLCLAFAEYIKNKKTDYTLAEFGLFGRLDAIRALFPNPEIHIISPIFYDHLRWTKTKKRNLKTLKEIVYEKTSFLAAGRIYIAKQSLKSLKLIKHYLRKNTAKCFYYGKDFKIKKEKEKYFYKDDNLNFQIQSELIGDFNYENMALAIKVALDEGVPLKTIKKSLKKISLPGRMQIIKSGKIIRGLPKSIKVIVDGAHNDLSSSKVCRSLEKIKNRELYAIIAMIKSKDPYSFLKYFKKFKKIYFIDMKQNNAYSKENLNKIAKKIGLNSETASNCYAAVKKIKYNKKALILITGSFYFLGNII